MKALAYSPDHPETNFFKLVEITKPSLGSNNAILKVLGVGLCGSDLLKLNLGLVLEGSILGHEVVGEIFEISKEMSELYGFKKGDRVISSHHVPCLECRFCLNKQESLCEQFKNTNFNPGAFCEYLELSELHLKDTVMKVPEHLSDEEASFTEPVACCIKAIKNSGILEYKSIKGTEKVLDSGAKILIIGLGSIGLIMGRLLKYYKAEIHLGGLDLLEYKRKIALNTAFDEVYENIDDSKKYSHIFLCAGADSTIELALKTASRGASIVVFSSVPDKTNLGLGFPNNEIYYKELKIIGSYSPNLEDLKESLDLISARKIQVADLISHRRGLEDFEKGNRTLDFDEIKTYFLLRPKLEHYNSGTV
jgi:L-iditol 2-dehydrogenase